MKTPCFSLCSDHRPPRPPKRFHPPSEQHEYQTTKRPVDWADDDNDDSNDNDDRDDDDDDADDDDDDGDGQHSHLVSGQCLCMQGNRHLDQRG